MPNEKNLIPNSERTPKERAELAAKMGRASGKARRKRKAMREVLNQILTMPAPFDSVPQDLAIEAGEEVVDNQTLLLAQLVRKAQGYSYMEQTEQQTPDGQTIARSMSIRHLAPDIKATQEIRNILGDSRDTAAEKSERKARTEKLKADTAAIKAKNSTEAQDAPDDGFLAALDGKAAEDWSGG